VRLNGAVRNQGGFTTGFGIVPGDAMCPRLKALGKIWSVMAGPWTQTRAQLLPACLDFARFEHRGHLVCWNK
jgi:hypothetical protein